jgi:hypothetical protein
MSRVACTTTINRPADALWRAISDFGAAGRHLFGIVACTVDGRGVGARRTLTSGDGSTVLERLETLDGVDRRLSYRLLTDTPFRACLTTMAVHTLGPDRAELEWSATFEPDGLPEREAVALLEGALATDSLTLKQVLERDAGARVGPDPPVQ